MENRLFNIVFFLTLKSCQNIFIIHCISQIAEQANKLSAFHNVSAFNYPEMQELEKIADRYNHISNDLETVIDDGANNQYHEDENETIYDKKEDKDTK